MLTQAKTAPPPALPQRPRQPLGRGAAWIGQEEEVLVQCSMEAGV